MNIFIVDINRNRTMSSDGTVKSNVSAAFRLRGLDLKL